MRRGSNRLAGESIIDSGEPRRREAPEPISEPADRDPSDRFRCGRHTVEGTVAALLAKMSGLPGLVTVTRVRHRGALLVLIAPGGAMSSLHHSEQTHANLVARLPEATGRPLDEWFKVMQDGPALTRFEERVHWLQDECELPHSYATAVVHEFDMVRAARRVQ